MMWVGKNGSNSVAAVGTAGFYPWLAMAFVMFSKIGGEVKVAQSMGEKNIKEVKSYIGNSKNGKLAILEYSVIKILNNKTLLDINLITGRHHQIRVQFSHRQHPLVGDVLYGGSHYNQLMLYAYEISFYHPITNNRLIFNKIPTSELWDQFLK